MQRYTILQTNDEVKVASGELEVVGAQTVFYFVRGSNRKFRSTVLNANDILNAKISLLLLEMNFKCDCFPTTTKEKKIVII